MYPTSPEYQVAVYAQLAKRRVVGKVTFDITDVDAYTDVSSIVVTAEEPIISNRLQLANQNRNPSINIATLEPGRFKLDGSLSFADGETPAYNGERGYVSQEICGADGVFVVEPTITITFGSTHSSAGLTVSFDQLNGEYATHFTAVAYDASDNVIDTVAITDNTEVVCVFYGQLLDYKKIVVTVHRWSVGHRRARVLEVDFGLVEVYDDNVLISTDLIEEMDMTSSQLPSTEFGFTVDNSSRRFNILNPTGIYKYLQQRQIVIAELGIDTGGGVIEYVPLGRYLLWEWTSDEGSLTASFTARTNLDLMSNYEYEQLTASSKSLAALAAQIFAQCGISNYEIDPALSAISTNSMSEKVDCKELLQMIAIAGCANIYISRDNVIHLKQLTLGASVDRVDFDNIYNEPQIELERIVRQVEVTYWTDLDTSAISTVTAPGVTLGDVLKLEGNTLINASGRAAAVASWLLAQKQYRAKYSVNWRGNPAHELSDVIAIENTFGGDMDAMITKNELTYAGYLRARTEARGAVN